jgi:hypothetical protein
MNDYGYTLHRLADGEASRIPAHRMIVLVDDDDRGFISAAWLHPMTELESTAAAHLAGIPVIVEHGHSYLPIDQAWRIAPHKAELLATFAGIVERIVERRRREDDPWRPGDDE